MGSPFWIIGPGATGTFLARVLAETCGHTPIPVLTRQVNPIPRLVRVFGEPAPLQGKVALNLRSWKEQGEFPRGAVLLVTAKAMHLDDVLSEIAWRLPPDATVVLCQNGLGIWEKSQRLIPVRQLLRMTLWLGARLASPERLELRGVDRVEIGGERGPGAGLLQEALEAAQIPVRWLPDPAVVEWKKAFGNLAINALAASLGVRNGQLLEHEETRERLRLLVEEAQAVARGEGVEIPAQPLDQVIELIHATWENENSMLQDLKAGRATEIEWLNLEVVRRATARGLTAPTHQALGNLIQSLEQKA